MLRILLIIGLLAFSYAEVRVYRQIKDVSAKQTGVVNTSKDKGNLFEFTYDINKTAKTVKRIKVRRLDQAEPMTDSTEYMITTTKYVLGSKAGEGGETIIAVQKNGDEIISLGENSAFSSRASDFSQMITGVYERI